MAAKICAAIVVTGGAGVATYQVAEPGRAEPTTIAAVEPADAPEPLALRDEATATTPALPSEDVSDESNEFEATDAKEADTEAPEIVILSPESDSHHDDARLIFKGETEPGATVAAGPYGATVDDEGHWKIELILSEGANTATITATDAAGNVGSATVTVWFDVKEKDDHDGKDDSEHSADEKDDETAAIAFTAKQKYGTCDAVEPYDVFWGSATPNSNVTISSPYGSATVEVNKHGEWEKKVYFVGAPIGHAFTVTVSGENGSTTFQFTAKAPPVEEHDEKQDDPQVEHGEEKDGKE